MWGSTIGGAILQNELQKELASDFLSQLPAGSEIAFAVISLICDLPEPTQSQVKLAFATSLKFIWQVLIGISGLGMLVSLLMKALPLHTSVDKDWGRKDVVRVDTEKTPQSS